VALRSGYAAFVLKEKKSASRDDFDKERESYVSRLRIKKQKDALVTYVRRLRSKVTDVKYNEVTKEPKEGAEGAPGEGQPPVDLE
jgi:peptidyl-prolyl cis-trans isomerase D